MTHKTFFTACAAIAIMALPAHAGYVSNDPLNYTDPTGMERFEYDNLEEARSHAIDAALANSGISQDNAAEFSTEVDSSLIANQARINLARDQGASSVVTASGAVNQRGAVAKLVSPDGGQFTEGTADGYLVSDGISFGNPTSDASGGGTTGIGILAGPSTVITNTVDFNNVSQATTHVNGGPFLSGTAEQVGLSLQVQSNQLGAPSLTRFQSSMRQGDRASSSNIPARPVYIVTTPQ